MGKPGALPCFPRHAGGGRVSNPPLQSRCAASPSTQPSPVKGEGVGATLTPSSGPSSSSGEPQDRPSPLPSSERSPCYSVVWPGRGYEGGERPGVVESMGPSQGSGSCQCASSFSLILRSAGVSWGEALGSSSGEPVINLMPDLLRAGLSCSSSFLLRWDSWAFLRMAALAFPSRRRCVRVRRVGRVLSCWLLVLSWERSAAITTSLAAGPGTAESPEYCPSTSSGRTILGSSTVLGTGSG